MRPTKNRDYSKMNAIMKSLGCEGEDGQYSSEDLNVDFDLSAADDNQILLAIGNKMADMGYRACKQELRDFING